MRFWTVEEARAYLPRVRELVEVIRRAALVRAGRFPSPNGQRSLLVDAQEAYEELQEGDIILRDATSGLIDFHAKGSATVIAPRSLPRITGPVQKGSRAGRARLSARRSELPCVVSQLP